MSRNTICLSEPKVAPYPDYEAGERPSRLITRFMSNRGIARYENSVRADDKILTVTPGALAADSTHVRLASSGRLRPSDFFLIANVRFHCLFTKTGLSGCDPIADTLCLPPTQRQRRFDLDREPMKTRTTQAQRPCWLSYLSGWGASVSMILQSATVPWLHEPITRASSKRSADRSPILRSISAKWMRAIRSTASQG